MKKLILITRIILVVISISSCAIQKSGSIISKERINLKERMKNFKISQCKKDSLKDFSFHCKTYRVASDVKTAWNTYTNTNAKEAWSGPLNTFQKAYSREKDSLYLVSDSISPMIELNTIFQLNLRCGGILNIPVEFEITRIDEQNKTVEFSYGADNKSKGRQVLRFVDNGSETLVMHYSYFKSDSKARDKFLYPFFHEKCMDEFHQGMIVKSEIAYDLKKNEIIENQLLTQNK